jgi:ribosome-associated translation inhibitor RaiA|tara:strand:+ start:1595 stop:1993 length:399 start_codon:yes stop_codon:yes gene_type:complete
MVEKNAQGYIQKTLVKVKLNLKKNIVDKVDKKHNKYYYEFDRNLDNAKQSNTNQYNGKTRTGGLQSDHRIPKYYKGKEGYEARKVCDNFDLSYHCGTAVTYILRAYKKHDTPINCIEKAIAHLEFELEKLKQ